MSSRLESRRRWRGLISKQASSGLSIAEFCRRHVPMGQWGR